MPKHELTDEIVDKAYQAGAIVRVCRELLREWPMEGNNCPLAGDIGLALEAVDGMQHDIHVAIERSITMMGAANA